MGRFQSSFRRLLAAKLYGWDHGTQTSLRREMIAWAIPLQNLVEITRTLARRREMMKCDVFHFVFYLKITLSAVNRFSA